MENRKVNFKIIIHSVIAYSMILIMKYYIKENGKIIHLMDMESYIYLVFYMKVNLKIIKEKGMKDYIAKIEKYMKLNLKMIF